MSERPGARSYPYWMVTRQLCDGRWEASAYRSEQSALAAASRYPGATVTLLVRDRTGEIRKAAN